MYAKTDRRALLCAAMLLAASLPTLAASPARAARPVRIEYEEPATKVIGLYDSTEGRHGADMVLRDRAAGALVKLGLRLVLHDVAGGLPGAEKMLGVRAVVTAFDDGVMKDARGFARWLSSQQALGRRVVILNSFGAFREAEGGEWLPWPEVNRVLGEIGVVYDAQWTEDTSGLTVRSFDPEMFRVVPDVTRAGHYFRFRVVRPDARAHLVVDRPDAPDGDGRSAMVVTSPRGGMAVARYYETAQREEQVNLHAFLEAALFPRLGTPNRVLFVVDPESALGNRVAPNLRWIASYARLDARFLRMQDLSLLRRRDLRDYGVVVLASDTASLLFDPQLLSDVERWVYEDGGGLVCLFPVRRPEWDEMLGIARFRDELVDAPALRYVDAFYPGYDGMLVRGDSYSAKLYPVELRDDVRVFARGADTSRPDWLGPPVLWSRRHGAGRVVFRGDAALGQKEWRGSALQMILQGMPVSAAPVLGSLVYFLDDFPQPMWGVKKEPIAEEYGLTDTDFYDQVFWPDMLKMAEEFRLRMTLGLIWSYDDRVGPGGGGYSAEQFYDGAGKGVPAKLAKEALRLGHEVALHGYNHQSLVLGSGETSRGWRTRDNMMDGLRLARAEWERLFGPGQAPFTYIATNNHIDRAGKEALAQVFPEVRLLCAQYLDEEENDLEGGELDTDPDVEQLTTLPRFTSELFVGGHNNVAMHDGVALFGMWAHFVHPDDVYDPERNDNAGWRHLREASRRMLIHMTSSYPWLRSMTARDAYDEIIRLRSTPFRWEADAKGLTVRLAPGEGRSGMFLVRTDPDKEVTSVTNGRVVHAYPRMGYTVVEAGGPECRVSVGLPGPPPALPGSVPPWPLPAGASAPAAGARP